MNKNDYLWVTVQNSWLWKVASTRFIFTKWRSLNFVYSLQWWSLMTCNVRLLEIQMRNEEEIKKRRLRRKIIRGKKLWLWKRATQNFKHARLHSLNLKAKNISSDDTRYITTYAKNQINQIKQLNQIKRGFMI